MDSLSFQSEREMSSSFFFKFIENLKEFHSMMNNQSVNDATATRLLRVET